MHRFVRPSVFVAGGAVVLGSLVAAQPASAVAPVVINEFSASTTGTDVEYIELLAAAGTDLSGYRVLEIEGDSSTYGVVDGVFTPSAADASGRSLTTLAANDLENGTISLLLVTGTIPALGADIDANDDGVIDAAGLDVVDSVAVNDGGAGDRTYGPVSLGVAYDGLPFAPGGASRHPDGTDTDTTADWARNDFDLAGYPGFGGTPEFGEAFNTPGTANALVPEPAVADCALDVVTIGSLQGTGAATPVPGTQARIEGVVVGDFQTGGFDGYYVQDAGDGDSASSDGIFVYRNDSNDTPGDGDGILDVSIGDAVHVVGTVSEAFGMTQIVPDDVATCAEGVDLPAPTELSLPATDEERERLEGMYVTLPQSLAILEYFNFGRFGTISVGVDRQYQPTATFEPGSAEAVKLRDDNLAERITIDDGRGTQNPNPAIHPDGEDFTLENSFRGGDLVTDATGILDYRFGVYGIQPTQGARFTAVNDRPDVPDVGDGELTVASFNVLNYFTTIDPTPANSDDDDLTRGADSLEEFERQEAKIVAALVALDADVFGLIEIENNGTAVAALTEALNTALGDDVYSFIDTGVIGTDAIATAFLYKTATVAPLGGFELLTQEDDERWLDAFNRPALTQTFQAVAGGEPVTVSVNHLKSKGSDCNAVGDPEDPTGQGNCNGVRTEAAEALVAWLATDPTGQGTADRSLVIGDLNAYDKEDPIDVFTAAGYTDLLLQFQGEDAYTYVFDGQLGYLDHALASPGLLADVTGAAAWNINADEPSLIDYDTSFKQPAQDALWAPDPYRSSDHDPVIVGLDVDTTAPTLTLTASPARIFPPDGTEREVTIDAVADDETAVTIDLVSVEATGSKKAEVTTVDDTTFLVVAANKAEYVFTYRATDAAGNETTSSVRVVVGARG